MSSTAFSCGDSDIQFDLPENFDFKNQSDYRIVGETLVYAPMPVLDRPSPPTVWERLTKVEDRLAALRQAVIDAQEPADGAQT